MFYLYVFMRFFISVSFLLLLVTGRSRADNYNYDYTPACMQAYAAYMALHLEEGNNAIKQEIVRNPKNLMAIYISDYEDCLLLLFNGNKTDYEQRKGHLDARITILERGNNKSPWYRLCKAGLYLHWAFVNIRMADNYRAALNFRKSFVLLRENRKLFPNFDYNNIYWGAEQAALGAIPDNYKWITSAIGMSGDVKRGAKNIEQFISVHDSSDPLKAEAVIFYSYLRFYLLYQQEEAWKYINSNAFPLEDNLMHMFVKSNIAVNYRKADVALETLAMAQKDTEYSRFPILEYEYGTALFLKLNLSCLAHFRKFLASYKGGFFVKDTWQKIAYAYFIQGNMHEANNARLKIKSTGTTVVDADKQAARFANNTEWPDRTLLESHLLIDGGYYKTALDRIGVKSESDYNNISDKLEYNFRLARIYDEIGDDSKALQYYQDVINKGRNRQEHFAARSALQMAFIYEKAGRRTDALAKYNESLSMHDHDFQGSIDQQAKAGVNRIK